MSTYTEYWKRALVSALASTETASGALHYRLYESPLKGVDLAKVRHARAAVDEAHDALRRAYRVASELDLGFS